MIRRTLRIGVRLGLLAGIAFALFKLVQGRRASDYGSPSPDWAPTPPPQPSNLPTPPPEPELVQPVILEEVIEKRKAATQEPEPEPLPAGGTGESVVKKAAPAKKAASKKAAPAPTAAPAKKSAPPKKAAAPAAEAPKKAAPAKKAPKKQG
ncbi:MAG TPA: hypothetical protein VL337_09380 [Acidimicrobiales bacterium]|nr:hypothetical protein [Acidimicrobiales bacterium]